METSTTARKRQTQITSNSSFCVPNFFAQILVIHAMKNSYNCTILTAHFGWNQSLLKVSLHKNWNTHTFA